MLRLVLVLSLWLSVVVAAAQPLRLDPQSGHDIEFKDLGNGEWELRTTGTDPYFVVRSQEPFDPAATPMLSFDYFSTTGVGRTLVFVGAAIDVPHMITTEIGRREGWAGFSVDLRETLEKPAQPPDSMRITIGQEPGKVIRMRNLKVRAATDEELLASAGKKEKLDADTAHAARLQDYLKRNFPGKIEKVSATAKEIVIDGIVPPDSSICLLAEVPMWQDVTDLRTPVATHPVKMKHEGRFEVKVDRASVKDRDILLSGWVLISANDGGLFSAMHYADEVEPRAALPPAKPLSKKGLGGCPFDHPDMQALGIHSVTANIILNDLLHSEAGEGRTPYVFAGRTWYVDERVVAMYDRQFNIAAEKGWMVSVIVLLPTARNAPEKSWIREAGHPEADPHAAFAMPNFTSASGVNAYAAAMNFVTERYSRPDGRYGRVHHWIMHNEINSGFFWTSAGTKTDLTYLDLYQKSMRVAWLLARQYDPHAKPLISLEHCWGRKADARGYAGRDLMEDLVAFSRVEGDFPWAIAFHPYPQDITSPRTWEDSEARFDFSTPYITYRNIEVIDAWARQPRVAYRGQPREVQLTEQGLNSPDYSEKSLRDQAAGMAYAWKKIEGLPTITAFQYHLWADDRGEGGLRLGLRKFGDDPQDPHGIKPIWNLYKALGTADFGPIAAPYLETVGLKGWDEAVFRGEVKN